jgi:hypothetical protein
VVICSDFVPMSPDSHDAKDGKRDRYWPIIGGRFWGPGIKGDVIPGGADFPVVRPDGVQVRGIRIKIGLMISV